MERVTIETRTGQRKQVSPRDARILVAIGKATLVEGKPKSAPKKQAAEPALAELPYNELQKMAAEAEVEPESRKKDDLVDALEEAGVEPPKRKRAYKRRDMQAEGE
jgi:hypothetical protein